MLLNFGKGLHGLPRFLLLLSLKMDLAILHWSTLRPGSQIIDYKYRFCDSYFCTCFLHRCAAFSPSKQPRQSWKTPVRQSQGKMVDPSSDPSQHQTLPSHKTVSKKHILIPTFHLTDYNWQKWHREGVGLFQPMAGVLPGAARRTVGGLCKLRLKEWANREPSSHFNTGSQCNDNAGNVATRKQKQRWLFNFSPNMCHQTFCISMEDVQLCL